MISFGSFFEFKEILYKRGNKRRKRLECLNMKHKKVYLFNQNVQVIQFITSCIVFKNRYRLLNFVIKATFNSHLIINIVN
jgi:hypothetical protein